MNSMKEVCIEKVLVNIGVGDSGEKLLRAEQVLTLFTDHKPVRTLSRTTNKDLGIRKGMPIGCKVTLRGEEAVKFIKDAFWVKNNKLAGYSFDSEGNFSFGIADYTDFKGMKYDPDIGIFGMDICVTLSRKGGKRVKNRKHAKGHIPKHHRLSPKEGKEFVRTKLNVEVVE
jgi:large subunit ribosomal protein L5